MHHQGAPEAAKLLGGLVRWSSEVSFPSLRSVRQWKEVHAPCKKSRCSSLPPINLLGEANASRATLRDRRLGCQAVLFIDKH